MNGPQRSQCTTITLVGANPCEKVTACDPSRAFSDRQKRERIEMPIPLTTSAALLDSIGVNTHMSYFDLGYGNAPLVAAQVKALGVRHIRDGAHFYPSNMDAFSVLSGDIRELGCNIDVVIDPSEKLGAITSEVLEEISLAYGSQVCSFEGMNEPDAGTPVGWPATARAWQQGLYSASTLPQNPGKVPVLACALADAAAHSNDLGNIAAWCDYANLHPYPAGQMPEPVIQQQLPYATIMAPGKPVMVTETGYFTGPEGDPAANGQPSVSELAQAKYTLRLLLAHLAAGVKRTYLYELQDEQAGGAWGLVRSDGTEKPVFGAVRNLISLLSPEPCLISNLDYSLSGSPVVESLLLQNRDNEWILFLWQALSVWKGQDIGNAAWTVNLSVPEVTQLRTYKPLLQSDPLIITWGTSAPVSVGDHPVAVVISK